MHKPLTRRLVLALAMIPLSGTVAHAATTNPSPTPQTVTGTDPVPTSPHIMTVLLILFQTLL